MTKERSKIATERRDVPERVYTPKEIQNILGVSRTHIYHLIETKTFRTIKIGNHYRISKKCFDRWKETNYGK